MSVKFKHSDEYSTYFCTFTCFEWKPLFDISNSYDLVYKWFRILSKKNIKVLAYVIMPNHLHFILYFSKPGFRLNSIISNAKRFMAYEIVKRLNALEQLALLGHLHTALTTRELRKGQLHRIFEKSFDAKPVFTDDFLYQKILYIHLNPLRGKWNLVNHFTDYEHSSASFYEMNEIKHFEPVHYRDL